MKYVFQRHDWRWEHSVFVRAAWAFFALSLACILLMAVLRLNFSLPSVDWRTNNATLQFEKTDSEPSAVRLPHQWQRAVPSGTVGTYTITGLSRNNPNGDPFALFIPRFLYRIEIIVDDRIIVSSASQPNLETWARNISFFARLPSRVGDNLLDEIKIRVHSRGILSGFLSEIYIGPENYIKSFYDERFILLVVYPYFIAIFSLSMSVLCCFFIQKNENKFLYFAATMFFEALHGLYFSPFFVYDFPYLHRLVHTFPIIFIPLASLALYAFLGGTFRKERYILLLIFTIYCPMFFLDHYHTSLYTLIVLFPMLLLPPILVFFYCIYLVFFRKRVTGLIFIGISFFIIGSNIHDVLRIANPFDATKVLIGRAAATTFTILISGWLIISVLRAIRVSQNFSEILLARLSKAEKELELRFEKEQEYIKKNALLTERSRLMRDLHDGVGGQLLSIVAISEKDETDVSKIASSARAALQDMRLIIDALDEIDGDLMLVLATWRERLTTRLYHSGMTLEWHNCPGLPKFIGLRPSHVLNIMRILEEAATNTIKHSKGSRLSIHLETATDEHNRQFGRISISDDGRSASLDNTKGRGINNMNMRAKFIGAKFDIHSNYNCTTIILDIPAILQS